MASPATWLLLVSLAALGSTAASALQTGPISTSFSGRASLPTHNVTHDLHADKKLEQMAHQIGSAEGVNTSGLLSSLARHRLPKYSKVVLDVQQHPTADIAARDAGGTGRMHALENLREFFHTNQGTFLVIREASRYIFQSGQPMPKGGAAIVNVASIFGKSGQKNAAAYCASKGGVVALTKSAAQELAPRNIRCNAVLPGCTETPMNATAPGDVRAEAIASTPLKRMAQPREIAEAIKFLCLPKASSFVTGAALEVTGGWRM